MIIIRLDPRSENMNVAKFRDFGDDQGQPMFDQTRRCERKMVSTAVLVVVLLAVSACASSNAAPYDRGCAFTYRCPQNGGG
jgi:hypothetical protein